MGTDYGASGAYGILLSEHQDELGQAYENLLKVSNEAKEEYVDDEGAEVTEKYDTLESYLEWRVGTLAKREVVEAFEKQGVRVPEGAELLWTGDWDGRPGGRCATPAQDWVLGFGLFKLPWTYPEMHVSFRAAAMFHEWVWAG